MCDLCFLFHFLGVLNIYHAGERERQLERIKADRERLSKLSTSILDLPSIDEETDEKQAKETP